MVIAQVPSEQLTLSVPLLVAAAGVALLWIGELVTVLALRRIPRIRSAPAGMELPDESPAVAGLLAADFVVPDETAPAILLDLAARRVVDLDEVQPGRTICRLRERADEVLSPAETRVLTAIRHKAVDGIVPTEALTTGADDMSKRWHRALEHDVVTEAQRAGLTIDRWPKAYVAFLGVGLGIVGLLLALALDSNDVVADEDEVLAAIAGAIAVTIPVLGVLLLSRLVLSRAQLPTAAGKAAAARVGSLEQHLQEDRPLEDLPPAAVKVRGRHFAYAAVFGAAPRAVALLPMGAEDDHRAWSSFGGRWRRVRVRYPRVWPPAWGRHPGFAALLGAVWLVVGVVALRGLTGGVDTDRPAGISTDAWNWVELGVILLMVPFVAAVVWAVWVLARALPDLVSHRTIRGQVVRDRRFERRFDAASNARYWHYLGIDDGTDDRIRALRLREPMWRLVSQGQLVEAEITPRLGYVRSLQPITPEPPASPS